MAAYTTGIDVSTYQGYPDWAAVRAGGIDFAVIKCGQGRAESSGSAYFTDSKFKYNIVNARAAGIGHLSVYYYFTARNVAEAKKEAEHCLSIIKPYKAYINGYVAIDVESKYLKGLSRPALTEVVRVFYDAIEAAGYKCIVYTNPDFLKNRLSDISDLDLWLALWRKKSSIPTGYSKMRIWQWGAASVPGIVGNVDANLGFFDIAADSDDSDASDKPVDSQRDKIAAGMTVRVENPIIYGTQKRFRLYYPTYTVISVNGRRAVIGRGKTVTAAVDIDYLEPVS